MKKAEIAVYEGLKEAVRNFVKLVRTRKATVAYYFNASEDPKPLTPNAPPQQFNVLEVRQLIAYVQTGQKLGYQTLLTTDGSKLFVNFVEQYPPVPLNMELA